MKTLLSLLPIFLVTFLGCPAARAQTGGHDFPPHPNVKLQLYSPASGTEFAVGIPILLQATAVSDGDAVYVLDFLSDGALIGTSVVNTLVAVPPGVPVQHQFLWQHAPVGIHAVTLRFTDASGFVTSSDPVKIIVTGSPHGLPTLTWTSPTDGAVVPTPGVVLLGITAVDPLGEIRRVEFYDGSVLLGVSEILTKEMTIPGRPRQHSLLWTNPPAGPHTLVAAATASDNVGLKVPLRITVVDGGGMPVVTVLPGKQSATESGDFKSHFFSFRFLRTGDLSQAVTAYYVIRGTATPGVDYSPFNQPGLPPPSNGALAKITFPTGQDEVDLGYAALADNVKEETETVVVQLVDSPLGSVPTYRIGDPSLAHDEILDSTPDLATIDWVEPSTGDHFASGVPIQLVVTTRDPAGLLTSVDFYSGDVPIGTGTWNCPECRMAPGATLTIRFVWNGAPSGLHTLHAEAFTANGERVVSPLITLAVDDVPPPGPVAVRHLPAGFQPGVAFTVTIEVTPDASVQDYVVEDHPPFLHWGGAVPPPESPWWNVTSVGDGGVFDGPNGAVKFGPFFDSKPRVLTYQVTPNEALVDQAVFEGVFVADGTKSPIGGDSVVNGSRRHPADISPADDRIDAEELTAYGAAWRLGKLWNGTTIPVDYVTQAALLWRSGEQYRFDPSAGPAPLWWVSNPFLPPAAPPGAAATSGSATDGPKFGGAVYAVLSPGTGDSGVLLQVRALPGPSTVAYAVELRVGAIPTNVSDGGQFDAASNTLRWGPFTDGSARTLKCSFPGSQSVGFKGGASFDGRTVTVLSAGPAKAIATGPRLIGPSPTREGAMQLVVEDPGLSAGAAYGLEISADLLHWTSLGVFQTGAAAAFARDELPASDTPRFYRAVRRQ